MAKDLMKWTNVSSLQNEINRMFDQFFRGWDFSGFGQEAGAWSPSIDLSETDDNIVVKAEIPGIDPKEVNISIQDNNLIIKGEKKEEKEEKGKNYYRMERSYGRFSRSVELPASVDMDKVNAECKNGVLEITLPKKEEVRPKQISVKVS
ncbi:MAG: Hsp20/alpha crystallin family protein [Candidatus Kuenenia stuttgartiensis]|uniref:Strongly similar to small heat shock protein n=1 Tax=Kuenenia stuttgartiensis TaxID=174633 RepID=A0A2C9CKA3_KUEST|nr:Hsp20/alpha crystallin family protein [Candidatus Kuenenia stuttgartiensis]MBE7545581.1 Hsp20/alpha crystallin family protein [Planctomycetia bacterium]MBW7942867.1 Hsp20/alpha crystallin family protein [Candidatus Kuenenia stuttgartiensis]MBZ0191605.1 Hsp20/alpha crystallin family protein [Candidatus Kuenenia stuttgartiensis]SOH05217.1 strongly similar to small heat shock protein [Candidatus Kuenenia stuttgartiensis]GJQ48640.1 MAG: molecular chaperone [Candidatus Kuenenia stuttgartiensis]